MPYACVLRPRSFHRIIPIVRSPCRRFLGAIETPLEIVKLSCELIPLLRGLMAQAKLRGASGSHDGDAVGIDAVIDGCGMVEENMKTQTNQQLIESIRQRFSRIEQMLVDAKSLCYTPPFDSWSQNMLNILKLR